MDTNINYNFNNSTTPLSSFSVKGPVPIVGEGLAVNDNFDYIMSPVDSEGVTIYLGDEVYLVNQSPSHHFTVKELTINEDGWEINGYEPSFLRHWKVPKVSSLLMEFMADLNSKHWSNSKMNSLINDYEKRIKEAVEYEQIK